MIKTKPNQAFFLEKVEERILESLSWDKEASWSDQPALAANMPPLFDAERLSFWLCHVLMPANDAKGRHAWLRCESTRDRLQFCAERLLSAEGKGAGNAAPGQ